MKLGVRVSLKVMCVLVLLGALLSVMPTCKHKLKAVLYNAGFRKLCMPTHLKSMQIWFCIKKLF